MHLHGLSRRDSCTDGYSPDGRNKKAFCVFRRADLASIFPDFISGFLFGADSKTAVRPEKESEVKMTETINTSTNKYSAKIIAKMGMMAAIACVFGLFRFPILPMVPFLTYDFADIPIIISAFAFGPVAGLLITLVVSFIQAFLLGGDQLYGFIMHVLASGTFVLIASLIYRQRKSKKVAIISLAIATVVMIIVMGIANYFVTPFYYGGEAMRDVVVQLMPFILLFNLIKGVANSLITLLIYKRISPFLHKK